MPSQQITLFLSDDSLFISYRKLLEAGQLKPTDDAAKYAIQRLIQNPRNSVIAQMGASNIANNGLSLEEAINRWEVSLAYEEQQKDQLMVSEHEKANLVARTRRNFDQIERELTNAISSHERVCSRRDKTISKIDLYERRIKVATLLRKILIPVHQGNFNRWAEEAQGDRLTIEEIRGILNLRSGDDCRQLTRVTVLAVLRIMHLMNYAKHTFFRGLWAFPPNGVSRQHWTSLYGLTPTVLTGRGTVGPTIVEILRARVAHYLGFDYSTDVVPNNNPSNLNALKQQLEAQLEEVQRRIAAANAGAATASTATTAPAVASAPVATSVSIPPAAFVFPPTEQDRKRPPN